MTLSKVIFLDIDGVLNSEAFYKDGLYRNLKIPDLTSSELFWAKQLCVTQMSMLNTLVYLTGAKVVVSSTWRKMLDLKALNKLFKLRGAEFEIMAKTVVNNSIRGEEIQEFINEHKVESYIILDDDSDFLPEQLPYHVHVHYRTGLNQQDLDISIALLGLAPDKELFEDQEEIKRARYQLNKKVQRLEQLNKVINLHKEILEWR